MTNDSRPMTSPAPLSLEPELQPCQCGNADSYISVHEWGHPYTRAWYVTVCRKCWMQSPRYFSRAEAVDWWNNLAASAQREAALEAKVAELEARNEKLGRLLQDAVWECADCEMNLDAIRALLKDEAPVYSSLGRWLYGGDGLDNTEDNGDE